MDRQIAEMTIDSYFRTHENPVDLNENQILVVIAELMKVESAGIKDVARIIKREFPMRLSANRYNRTEQPQQTQSKEDWDKIIIAFLRSKSWSEVAPLAIPPYDANGLVSAINRDAFAAAINRHTVCGTGTNPVRADILAAIVLGLDQAKPTLLEHYPPITERIVQVEKPTPLSVEEQAKRNRELDRRMNAKDNPTIKGIGDHGQPKATQEEILKVATQHKNDNEAAGRIIAIIGNHRGKSRGATEAEKTLLENILTAGRETNTAWPKIEAQIDAQIVEMSKWDSSEAIRRVYANAASSRGVDLTKRTPNPFRQDVY